MKRFQDWLWLIFTLVGIGVFIAVLVPGKSANFLDKSPLKITLDAEQQTFDPVQIPFRGKLNDSEVFLICENIYSPEKKQPWIKAVVNKEKSVIELTAADPIPKEFGKETFCLVLGSHVKKEIVLQRKNGEDAAAAHLETAAAETAASPADASSETSSAKQEQPPVETAGKSVVEDAPQAPVSAETGAESVTEPPVTVTAAEKSLPAETKADIASAWPKPLSTAVNTQLKGVSAPFSFELGYGKRVLGQSLGREVPFATYKNKMKNKSPACVYQFTENDPVGELHALWNLGGRLLLTDETGKRWILGKDAPALIPEIVSDRQEFPADMILKVNGRGEELFGEYCKVMSIPPGSLSITLPEKLWSAVYQTISKVAIDNNRMGAISKPGTEVYWRLGGTIENYAIVVNTSDLPDE